MNHKFKPYNPEQAKQRQQKRSSGRSTLVPTSSTRVGSLPPPSLVSGHRYSQTDEKSIPLTITNGDENPYSGFPSLEECLDFCLPTSGNPVLHTDSAIDFQHTAWDHRCRGYGYKDDNIMPVTSDLSIQREAYNINTSEEGTNIEISSSEHTWSPDTKTTPSTVSSISTPLATSPHCQKQSCRNQDSFIHGKDNIQDISPQVAHLDVSDAISHAALSGGNSAASESQEPSSSAPSDRRVSLDDMNLRAVAAAAASILPSITAEPSITESISVASSSTKRSFSESGASNNSQPFSPVVGHSSKRLKLTSASVEGFISTLLDAQKAISTAVAKLCQDQPDSSMPYVSAQSVAGTIEVAADTLGGDNNDYNSNCSDNESERDATTSQRRHSQQRSTQRRRWTSKEEKLLRALKATQKRNGGRPSDYQIANRLDRTESGMKQHWDLMSQKKHR